MVKYFSSSVVPRMSTECTSGLILSSSFIHSATNSQWGTVLFSGKWSSTSFFIIYRTTFLALMIITRFCSDVFAFGAMAGNTFHWLCSTCPVLGMSRAMLVSLKIMDCSGPNSALLNEYSFLTICSEGYSHIQCKGCHTTITFTCASSCHVTVKWIFLLLGGPM